MFAGNTDNRRKINKQAPTFLVFGVRIAVPQAVSYRILWNGDGLRLGDFDGLVTNKGGAATTRPALRLLDSKQLSVANDYELTSTSLNSFFFFQLTVENDQKLFFGANAYC